MTIKNTKNCVSVVFHSFISFHLESFYLSVEFLVSHRKNNCDSIYMSENQAYFDEVPHICLTIVSFLIIARANQPAKTHP